MVGQSSYEAFIWDNVYGMQSLRDILIDLGLDLTSWTLSEARSISTDGLTIAGFGTNPDGYNEAWVAVIPEPATLLLLGFGAVILRKKRS